MPIVNKINEENVKSLLVQLGSKKLDFKTAALKKKLTQPQIETKMTNMVQIIIV